MGEEQKAINNKVFEILGHLIEKSESNYFVEKAYTELCMMLDFDVR